MNIELLPLTEVRKVEGDEGNFTVHLRQAPRYIDPEKCIACGECSRKCPKKISNSFNAGLDTRKSVHILYDQTVPLKYAIDEESCIYLQKGKCGACAKVCPADAVNFNDKPREFSVNVGSVVLAPGIKTFDPSAFDSYAYSRIPDVITSLEYERLLSASGPCQGHVLRPSDSTEPKRIAWLQCVGSRGNNKCDNDYCSNVCCMYALKQALVTADHAHGEGHDQAIFFMDVRAHNKSFEQYYNQAMHKGVRILRARPHSFLPSDGNKGVRVDYVGEAGDLHSEVFDMVVLSVGLEAPAEAKHLAETFAIDLDRWNFAETDPFDPVRTSRKGVYVCGGFQEPKDIPRSVMEASAAASAATASLATARGTRTVERQVPEAINVFGETPRIGVFVCACGINISSVIDVHAVADYARALPGVVHVENNMFSCSQDTQVAIAEVIRKHRLNRVVVAACTPRTHEPLFRETLEAAGLNKYLFAMANIRNHGSWVHANDPAGATRKAKDQVRMAVASARHLAPLKEVTLGVTPTALVVGGGVSGMTAALGIAEQGFEVHLVEKEAELGGNARKLRVAQGRFEIAPYLAELEAKVRAHKLISLHTQTAIADVDGFVGNFVTRLKENGAEQEIRHGAVVLATGGIGLKPEGRYGYGMHPMIMTHQQIDAGFMDGSIKPENMQSVVFIQCVGSREPERPYCSRVCCTHTVESALHIKRTNPNTRVTVLYRDMRTYGQRELLYKEAREAGVIFSRFGLEARPKVSVIDGVINVTFKDHVLQEDLTVEADMLGLASAIVAPDVNNLAQMLKATLSDEGWYVEAHSKLRPVDFVTDGVFMAGLGHYPKPLEESVTQARAAVSRVSTVLSRTEMTLAGTVATINKAKCVGCAVCWNVCPYNAISPDDNGFAEVNEALCKGCGLCAAACRSGAPDLRGFTSSDIMAQVSAMLG